MFRFLCCGVGAMVCLSLALACGRGEAQKGLEVPRVLGQTPEELQARWGTPDISIRKSDQLSTLQWKDLGGVWVYAVSQEGRVVYVTYTFAKMEPFEVNAAFRRLGIQPPKEPPEHEWENGAKRWIPFGPYEKLTVNPKTKAVTVAAKQLSGESEE